MKTKIIGISGASASGKSTFANQLKAELGDDTVYIPIDRFYKKELPKIMSPLDGKEYPDWNHPTSIDSEAALSALNETIAQNPNFIILDGAFLFCIDSLRAMLDYKIFIDASIEMRIYRRIKRNVILKNQTIEQIGEYYLATVRYREKEFSIPSQKYADVIVNNENGFGNTVEEQAEIIRSL